MLKNNKKVAKEVGKTVGDHDNHNLIVKQDRL